MSKMHVEGNEKIERRLAHDERLFANKGSAAHRVLGQKFYRLGYFARLFQVEYMLCAELIGKNSRRNHEYKKYPNGNEESLCGARVFYREPEVSGGPCGKNRERVRAQEMHGLGWHDCARFCGKQTHVHGKPKHGCHDNGTECERNDVFAKGDCGSDAD